MPFVELRDEEIRRVTRCAKKFAARSFDVVDVLEHVRDEDDDAARLARDRAFLRHVAACGAAELAAVQINAWKIAASVLAPPPAHVTARGRADDDKRFSGLGRTRARAREHSSPRRKTIDEAFALRSDGEDRARDRLEDHGFFFSSSPSRARASAIRP